MTATTPATITPEQQIANVAAALEETLTARRHRWQTEAIRQTVRQLRELAERHARGELPAITDNGLPF